MSNAPHTWPRLHVTFPLSEDENVVLGPGPTHYLTHVIRTRPGDPVRIFNGEDGEWRAEVVRHPKTKKDGIEVRVRQLIREQTAEPDLWLCAAPIKRAHYDFMIQKATELGVRVIQPLLTSRTQIRDVNPERLLQIAIEAAEQSERLTIPDVREPITLDRLVATWPEKRLPILCAEAGEAQPIAQALGGGLAHARASAAVITGPEGGFMAEEIERLKLLPEALAVRLGPRILRADTAALAALSCWQAQCGDWQNRNWPKREDSRV